MCDEVRNIATGVQQFVPLDEMKGHVLVMANLKPRPLGGFQSNGMVVCASLEVGEERQLEIIRPEGATS